MRRAFLGPTVELGTHKQQQCQALGWACPQGPTLELGTHEQQQCQALSWACPRAVLSIGQKFSVPIHVLSSLVLPGLQTVPAITVAAHPWAPY